MKHTVQVVWFKRDLRLQDHAVLAAAATRGPVLPLFVVEPEYWTLPDVSSRQWRFWRDCVRDLGDTVAARGGQLVVRSGSVVDVLATLQQEIGRFALWAHEETGNWWTYQRDKAVHSWCEEQAVTFREIPQFGVVRGLRVNRDRWSSQWDGMMNQPVVAEPSDVDWIQIASNELPTAVELGLADDSLHSLPQAGRWAAGLALNSFLSQRGQHYTREMSSPLTAEAACSRLSWHIAYGTLSMREVYQAAVSCYQTLPNTEVHWRQSIRSFIARLHWHCHFIQKLESEPEAEWKPFARIYEGLRPVPADAEKLAAWSEGRTGYPFIDAAMRYLNAQGWINFRMRAMLMSFASYDLWLPWQETGVVLARKFIDYEPGIHWPQCQMQSGETGINTVRIYSPVKQGYDQDRNGDFIRRWVPELTEVPTIFVHEPWTMSDDVRLKLCPDYPSRVVDHAVAAKAAKDAIFGLRKLSAAKVEAKRVIEKHGSRKTRKAIKEHVVSPQLDLGF
jgi:deoxyribodipyrimidine photo-lyase